MLKKMLPGGCVISLNMWRSDKFRKSFACGAFSDNLNTNLNIFPNHGKIYSFVRKVNKILKKRNCLKEAIKYERMYPSQCRIQKFFWEASFLTSVARRKTALQVGDLGGVVSPPQWGPGAKPWKFLTI